MRHLVYTSALLILATCALNGQNAAKREFEVATVRRTLPDTIYESFVPTLNVAPGATLRIVNRQLKELIMIAWGIGGKQLAGPQWLMNPSGAAADVPRFEVVAKVPADGQSEQVPAMLQNLLEYRFKLRVHTEKRQITIYALEAGKGGLTVQPVPASENRQSGCARNMGGDDGLVHTNCQNMTLAQLAQQLQTLSPAYFPEGPVIDKTGLKQMYSFPLDWITQQQRMEGQEGPSMFDAIDKLGLHIEKQKGDADVLVVDQAERDPGDN